MPANLLTTLVGSIPSPSSNVIELGPLTLRMYGLCIALGVVAAVVISSKRWAAMGGNPDDISTIALWAVPAGVIGARLYHVATDWRKYEGRWGEAFDITNGGLGIPGGVALGVVVGIIVVKRKGLPVAPLLDVVAPAIPVAQAIGRLGNWFNQEVFGGPTTLPWGLEIDPQFRPEGYEQYETFHPTFLYEGLWNLALAGFIIWLGRNRRLRHGTLFAVYVLGYAVGRFWVELLRIDDASLILGIRVNLWMSAIVGAIALAFIVRNARKGPPTDEELVVHIPGGPNDADAEGGPATDERADADVDDDPATVAAGDLDGADGSSDDEAPPPSAGV